MSEQTINVADAKKHLSELLGRVAYGKERFTITRRGKPLARLVPAEGETGRLREAKGWLDEDDDFFKTIDGIIRNRARHLPRILSAGAEDEGPA